MTAALSLPPAFDIPEEMPLSERLRVFIHIWNERFGRQPIGLGGNCCVSFAACWLECVSPPWRRNLCPGLWHGTGIAKCQLQTSARTLLRLAGDAPAAALKFLPVARAVDIAVGDVGWLPFFPRPVLAGREWTGGFGIFGGLAPFDKEDEPFWWVLRQGDNARATAFPAWMLSGCAWGFRPQAGAGAAIQAGSGGKLRLV